MPREVVEQGCCGPELKDVAGSLSCGEREARDGRVGSSKSLCFFLRAVEGGTGARVIGECSYEIHLQGSKEGRSGRKVSRGRS